jgi:hypothetical protein
MEIKIKDWNGDENENKYEDENRSVNKNAN